MFRCYNCFFNILGQLSCIGWMDSIWCPLLAASRTAVFVCTAFYYTSWFFQVDVTAAAKRSVKQV